MRNYVVIKQLTVATMSEEFVTDDPVSGIIIQYPGLLFPILKYCIWIGCSLPPKSDIIQDDVNCPISLS